MWPTHNGTGDAGHVPKKLRKGVTLQKIAELLDWVVDWSLQQWLSATSRSESSLRAIITIEKKLCAATSAARLACVKALHFLWNTFHVLLKMQHLWECKITIRKAPCYTLLWFEKQQSSYGNLKQNEDKRPKTGEFNAAKDGL